MAKPKEITFFNMERNYARGPAWYRARFAGARANQITGEATPGYSVSAVRFGRDYDDYIFAPEDDAIARINAYNPDIKLIISFRHPLDRALSLFEKNRFKGRDGAASLQDALQEELDGRRRIEQTDHCWFYHNCYSRHVENILRHFPRRQLLFMIFEEWTRDQQGALDRVCDFLGAPRQRLQPGQARNLNAGRRARIPGLEKRARTLVKNRYFNSLYVRLGGRKGYERLSPKEHARLSALFSDDVRALGKLTGMDFSLWKIPGPD
jgi:hypothetical protein